MFTKNGSEVVFHDDGDDDDDNIRNLIIALYIL